MSGDGWNLWGAVHAQHAVLDVIKTLQAEGHHVRVVKVGDHSDVYVDGPIEAEAVTP